MGESGLVRGEGRGEGERGERGGEGVDFEGLLECVIRGCVSAVYGDKGL